MEFSLDTVVVGGCGHVGLPLALAFSQRGLNVAVYDTNELSVKLVNSGNMPFNEPGAAEELERALTRGFLASTDISIVSTAQSVVVVIGTPIDEHLNPDPGAVINAVRDLIPYLRDGQQLALRSTVYPGTSALVNELVISSGVRALVTFCPERIAEGHAMTELFTLPQIVSGFTEEATQMASNLFSYLSPKIVPMTPPEAELAKLFTNTWRYIKFATANQLFMMANEHGLDYEKIRAGIRDDYPRAADLPSAGFAAGPCLLKDTMQLAAFNDNNFVLGHAAMLVNEGLPLYIVSKLEAKMDLSDQTVGILGMAFKEESDDIRSSLSYKLRRVLRFKAERVLCHDPYVKDDGTLVSLEEIIRDSDVLILAAPHRCYFDLQTDTPIIDIWGRLGNGTVI